MVNCFHKHLLSNVSKKRLRFRNYSMFLERSLRMNTIIKAKGLSFSSKYFTQTNSLSSGTLSASDIDVILRRNEFTKELLGGPVKSYDTNQLASNTPIEDMRCEAVCTDTNGLLVGVFDGHAGAACAHVASKRLFDYIAAAMLPYETLLKYVETNNPQRLIEILQENNSTGKTSQFLQEINEVHGKSFSHFLRDLIETNKKSLSPAEALEQSILRLDEDISKEVLLPYTTHGVINKSTLSVALSGSVACVVHVDGPNLHVANVGDCNAVIGMLGDNDNWIANKITKEHNADNFEEVDRIVSEHPPQEKKTVIRRNRLLGELAPLRSLGDYRYKWPIDILTKVVVPYVGQYAIPSNYHTPPYLTAKPEVFYHRINPNEKFLILASDGLWDMITPLQAVRLVGEHMVGKVFFSPLKLPRKNLPLGVINELLSQRRENLRIKPKDRNAATHLVRHAIGGTEFGVDDSRLSHLLSLPPEISRMFRDDITVTVVYFDSDFIRHCPT